MDGHTILKCFEYNAEVILQQLETITHAESLLQPCDTTYSINWLLGHIISARTVPLQRVGAEPVWEESVRARYRNGSAPVQHDANGVLPLDTLIELFGQTQARLVNGLAPLSDEKLNMFSGYGGNTVADSLLYFHFHETYHVGQLTLVAASLGKPAAYLDL